MALSYRDWPEPSSSTSPGAQPFSVGIGACGTFTTFSSFSVDTLQLWGSDRSGLAAVYALSTLVFATGAVATAGLLGGPA